MDVTFRFCIAASPPGKCQIQNHTGMLHLLMSFGSDIRKRVNPQVDTNVRAGTLERLQSDIIAKKFSGF
jgi:hypothetical protein